MAMTHHTVAFAPLTPNVRTIEGARDTRLHSAFIRRKPQHAQSPRRARDNFSPHGRRRRHCNIRDDFGYREHIERSRGYRGASSTCAVVILGGSSGVGLEAANHLHANGVSPTTFSRRTGHDLRDPAVAQSVLRDARGGVAISVGAGRRVSSRDDELALYSSIVSALAAAAAADPDAVGLIVAVARTLILPEVRKMFETHQRELGRAQEQEKEQSIVNSDGSNSSTSSYGGGSTPGVFDWVIVRPGALVDIDARKRRVSLDAESLLVTADPRCNGLVSRRAAGAVVAGLLLGRVPRDKFVGNTLGIYDRNRMQSLPDRVLELGSAELWRRTEPPQS